jgi:hypothetical protein
MDDRGWLQCRFEGCSKSYRSAVNLQNHEDQEHRGFGRFACAVSDCDKSYAQKGNLKVRPLSAGISRR